MGMDTFRDWTELNELWDARQPAVEDLGGLSIRARPRHERNAAIT